MSKSSALVGVAIGLVLALGVMAIAAFGAVPSPAITQTSASGSLAIPGLPTGTGGGDVSTAVARADTPVPSPAASGALPTAVPPQPTAAASATATVTLPPQPSPGEATATPALTATSPASGGDKPPASPTLSASTGGGDTAASSGQVIGYSVEGRPLVAHRIGQGPVKVVLVGDIHGEYEANTHLLAQQLLAHFESAPEEVPGGVSLWIVPTMNPDGLATGHRWNANDVDLNRNADTDLDGCAGNDWAPDTVGQEGKHPGAGGAYPFSEPESKAMRGFLGDAWIVVFYHSEAEEVYADTCQRHLPSARLAEALSRGTGYPVPESGWSGYRITGDWGDYLAGEGVAAATVELADHADPELERNLKGVQALLADVDAIVWADADRAGAGLAWLSDGNTGVWRYAEGSLVHPLAIEVLSDTAYVLDSGRVLSIDLAALTGADGGSREEPGPPQVVLAPGDEVEGVTVLEPLDMTADGDDLLVLDRAGDVYRYRPASDSAEGAATGRWAVDRVGRPSGETSNHYSVALAADGLGGRALLDTSFHHVWRFEEGEKGSRWFEIPAERAVDLDVLGERAWVATRATNNPRGTLRRYTGGRLSSAFKPNVDLMRPRQVRATDAAVYVLDRAGQRLVDLDPTSGALQAIYQFPDRRAVGAVWAAPTGGSTALDGVSLILAGRDALYFYGRPQPAVTVDGTDGAMSGANDEAQIEGLRGLAMPIAGAHITSSDFQIPGAPRHYRQGVHEGTDFYGYMVGVPVDRSTPVLAVADGVVIRAMADYKPLTAAQATAWAADVRRLGYTSDEVLDGYRGRQVWIEHAGGWVSRYAHLSSIAPGIVVGAQVKQGQVIAQVGNSGTPESLNGPSGELHLHLELWMGDHHLGEFMRPIETREWLEKILR